MIATLLLKGILTSYGVLFPTKRADGLIVSRYHIEVEPLFLFEIFWSKGVEKLLGFSQECKTDRV